jgi:hypothetical protein
MRSHSVYSLDCICGHHIKSETTELICPGCQRQIAIDWPAQAAEIERSEEQASSRIAA